MRIEYIQCCAKNELGHTKLNSVDLTLRTGSFNVVSGDDRSGKNFLLYLVYGIVRCSDGAVMVDNKDLALFNKRILKKHKQSIVLISKSPEIIPRLNVFANVALPLEIRGYSREKINIKVNEALKMLNIRHLEFANPERLAAGLRQKICIARCWALRPKTILINDMFFHLNPKDKELTSELLTQLNETGTTILMVTDITRIHKIERARYHTLWRGELSPS